MSSLWDCNSLGPCPCSTCAHGRNLACVMYGPNRGTRAVFWHPVVVPNTIKPYISTREECSSCGAPNHKQTTSWLCEDRRRAAREQHTTRLAPYLAVTRYRNLTDVERNRDIRVSCVMETYSCTNGCDAESVSKWREYLENNREPTPQGLALAFHDCHIHEIHCRRR